uniref:Uncharacterized protein n=1 Tax=Rhizophora mucronata TaxID=61149 RepID=A0A2P2R3U8_RHIMU
MTNLCCVVVVFGIPFLCMKHGLFILLRKS